MRDFNKVSPAVWQSRRFMDLPSDDGRLLYLYLLTCHHQNSAGCFWLPDGYACNDLRWAPERYKEAREDLVEADLIRCDEAVDVVLIERWFRHNPPMNISHYRGIERQLDRVPSDQLRDACREALEDSWAAIQDERASGAPAKGKAAGGLRSGPSAPTAGHLSTPYLNGSR